MVRAGRGPARHRLTVRAEYSIRVYGRRGAALVPWFKAAVFVLLACNAALFSVAGTLSEGLDSIAWLTLLIPAWAWSGEWFDAHDAALWLVAFVAIEINVLSGASRGEARLDHR